MQIIRIWSKNLSITSRDSFNFRKVQAQPHRRALKRASFQFPALDDSQTLMIRTSRGTQLNARKRDFPASEVEIPNDCWLIDLQVFEEC